MRFQIADKSGVKTNYLASFLKGVFIDAIVNEPHEKNADYTITLEYRFFDDGAVAIEARGEGNGRLVCAKDTFTSDELRLYASSTDDGNLAKALRLSVIKCLRQLMNRPFQWGILTGVRPTKTVGFLMLAGIPKGNRRQVLEKMFGLSPIKSGYLVNIADFGIKCRPENYSTGYLLYVSIPYCPSRCSYCSFFTGIGTAKAHEEYLQALYKEMQAVGSLISSVYKQVDAVYIGGGTPAILGPDQVKKLVGNISENFSLRKDCEITFEAGRPEIISRELVAACKDSKITRICVNPQTMQPETMVRIGRRQNIFDVENAVKYVKAAGNLQLNMDLIFGLPGENEAEMVANVKSVLEYKPDNITLHALALKRAASLRQEGVEHLHQEVNSAFEKAVLYLSKADMKPYYLYRQKFTAGDLENVGYATAGNECYYNMSMIEDWQTVVALGAGANSKYITSKSTFTRDENPKDPGQYQQRLDELIIRKAKSLADHLNELNFD